MDQRRPLLFSLPQVGRKGWGKPQTNWGKKWILFKYIKENSQITNKMRKIKNKSRVNYWISILVRVF